MGFIQYNCKYYSIIKKYKEYKLYIYNDSYIISYNINIINKDAYRGQIYLPNDYTLNYKNIDIHGNIAISNSNILNNNEPENLYYNKSESNIK